MVPCSSCRYLLKSTTFIFIVDYNGNPILKVWVTEHLSRPVCVTLFKPHKDSIKMWSKYHYFHKWDKKRELQRDHSILLVEGGGHRASQWRNLNLRTWPSARFATLCQFPRAAHRFQLPSSHSRRWPPGWRALPLCTQWWLLACTPGALPLYGRFPEGSPWRSGGRNRPRLPWL